MINTAELARRADVMARRNSRIRLWKGHITNYAGEIVVIGVIKEPNLLEDHFIRTSAIQMLSPNTVETKNSIYSLGDMAKP